MPSAKLIKKGEYTTNKVLNWLYQFKYSKASILMKVSGISLRGIRKSLEKMEENGLVISENMPLRNGKVYGITWAGICEIGENEEHRKFELSKFNHVTSIHNFHLQLLKLYILNRHDLDMEILNKKTIGNCHRMPDAVIRKPDNIIAVELERTLKTTERYKRIFGDYIEDIINKKYHHVQYFVTRKSALKLQSTFDNLRKIIIKNKEVKFDEPYKQYFKITDCTHIIDG